MRAYYHDNLPEDPRSPHIAPDAPPVDDARLKALGVLHWSIPVDSDGKWEHEINKVAEEREYKNRDVVESSRALFGDELESKLALVYDEHIHEDEEIRYVLAGSSFFDIREHSTDAWIRIHVDQGNLLVVPAGIYHRFTLDTKEYVRVMRLFKDEPKWQAHYRSTQTDANPHRLEYLQTFHGVTPAPVAVAA